MIYQIIFYWCQSRCIYRFMNTIFDESLSLDNQQSLDTFLHFHYVKKVNKTVEHFIGSQC